MIKETMPALIAVWQPASQCYRVFMTGGQFEATKWVFGSYNGHMTFTKATLPMESKKWGKGVYSL